MTIEEEIDAVIRQYQLDHEKWQREEIEVKKEAKKREPLFQKFNGEKPSWWLKPGVTSVSFDGGKVTFSRLGKDSFTIEDIKRCDINADGRTIKRDESAPFDFSTKHNVSFGYPTHGGKEGGGYKFYDGTEMSIMVTSNAYERKQNEQEDRMREELGC